MEKLGCWGVCRMFAQNVLHGMAMAGAWPPRVVEGHDPGTVHNGRPAALGSGCAEGGMSQTHLP